jgi:hypothetical protein
LSIDFAGDLSFTFVVVVCASTIFITAMHKTEKKKADARFLRLPLAAIVLRIVVVNNKSFPQKTLARATEKAEAERECVR